MTEKYKLLTLLVAVPEVLEKDLLDDIDGVGILLVSAELTSHKRACDVCGNPSESLVHARHTTTDTRGYICESCYDQYDSWITTGILLDVETGSLEGGLFDRLDVPTEPSVTSRGEVREAL